MLVPPSLHGRSSHYPKPVIGIAGGIGAGKSFIAQAFADLGCAVISSDADAHRALALPEVKDQVVAWWGPGMLKADGQPDRRAIAAAIFDQPDRVELLNQLIHPRVRAMRDEKMRAHLQDPSVLAVVWDTPLLFEVAMDRECDAVIFVKAPYQQRLDRIAAARGWTDAELTRREKFQIPLDKKQNLADYSIDNSGEATTALRQVREIFSQILSRKAPPA